MKPLESIQHEEFRRLQLTLLKHKYLYYVKAQPIISDYDYDMLEEDSIKMARMLGFRADKWDGPTPDEVLHVHWMVGFDENHPMVKEAISGLD